MKFKYLIMGTETGKIEGTNDSAVAAEFSEDDAYLVVDVGKAIVIFEDGEELPIEEVAEI